MSEYRKAIQQRFHYSDFVTLSWLTIWNGARFAIVERPWMDNKAGVSCIPIGTYICEPSRYNRGGYDAVEISNVPGRSLIKQHIANYPWDVEGCQGINTRFGCLKGQPCGVASTPAFGRLMELVNDKPYQLQIINKSGGILNVRSKIQSH